MEGKGGGGGAALLCTVLTKMHSLSFQATRKIKKHKQLLLCCFPLYIVGIETRVSFYHFMALVEGKGAQSERLPHQDTKANLLSTITWWLHSSSSSPRQRKWSAPISVVVIGAC